MISVRDLRKTYRVHRKAPGLMGSVRGLFRREHVEKHAVAGVSLEVGEGEIVGLIGANGAGKTTLVKMLAGIIHPSGGEARVLGHDPWRREDAFRRQIALIMGQKAQLWWDLPAADCFLLLREIYQVEPRRHAQVLEELTERLGVRDQLNIQIRRLSLGERMKMELIAALLHTPRVVFLDEPTIGLDLTAQRAIREFVLDYQREHSPAMLLTSHYMEDIERLCRRIVILRAGAVVYDGLLSDVLSRYARHKVVTAHLAEGSTAPSGEEVSRLGKVLESTDQVVRIQIPRGEIAPATAHLMQSLRVHDLAIEEEDIGSVIEAIMMDRGAPAP